MRVLAPGIVTGISRHRDSREENSETVRHVNENHRGPKWKLESFCS